MSANRYSLMNTCYMAEINVWTQLAKRCCPMTDVFFDFRSLSDDLAIIWCSQIEKPGNLILAIDTQSRLYVFIIGISA